MVLLQANIETKVVLMVAMVCGIIVVDSYLIVVEYLNASLKNREQVANLSGNALVSAVRNGVPASAGGAASGQAAAPQTAAAGAPAIGSNEGGGQA